MKTPALLVAVALAAVALVSEAAAATYPEIEAAFDALEVEMDRDPTSCSIPGTARAISAVGNAAKGEALDYAHFRYELHAADLLQRGCLREAEIVAAQVARSRDVSEYNRRNALITLDRALARQIVEASIRR